MPPTLLVDADAYIANVERLTAVLPARGIGVVAVLKALDSHPFFAAQALGAGVAALADSRLSGLTRLARCGLGPRQLIRPPSLSELDAVAAYADSVILSDVALADGLSGHLHGRELEVLLAVDIGDRREGVPPSGAFAAACALSEIPGLRIAGVAANYGCVSGMQPTLESLRDLEMLTLKIGRRCRRELRLSLGGSVCLPLALGQYSPRVPCEIRLGVALILGHYILPGVTPLSGLIRSDPMLVAEVLESYEKDPAPEGITSVDCFGRTPSCRLPRERTRHVLLAVGRRDTAPECLHPLLRGTTVVGMSTDLTVVSTSHDIRAGDTMMFALDYEGLVRAMTSPFVHREYVSMRPGADSHHVDYRTICCES